MCRITIILAIAVIALGAMMPPSLANDHEALLCYYDSNGDQHDADTCEIPFVLYDDTAVQYGARCGLYSGAACQVGNYGDCATGSHRYRYYEVLHNSTPRCPQYYQDTNYQQDEPDQVDPACPTGYVFSVDRCVRDADPTPSCPDGYYYADGECLPESTSNEYTQFDVLDRYDLPGGDYHTLPGQVHYDDCEYECKQDSRCLAFTYNTQNRQCFLKDYVNPSQLHRDAISGIKQ